MPASFESKLKKYLKNTEIMKTPSCLETGTIGLYIEDKLPKGEKMSVEKHLSSCLYCLNQLLELRELIHFQKQSPPLPGHLLQKIQDLYPRKERERKSFLEEYLPSTVERLSDFFMLPLRHWRYATVSLATALVVISALVIHRGFTPERTPGISSFPKPGNFALLSLTEAKSPIVIETADIDHTFEQVRRAIRAHNGKMVEALWVEKGIRLNFILKKEEEASLLDDFRKLGEVGAAEKGYRDKKGNIVVLLKER